MPAAIRGAIDCVARPFQRGIGAPRRAMGVPGGGEQNLRCSSRDRDVSDSDLGSFVEHALPVISTIGGFVDAAFIVGAIGMTQRAHIDSACVIRIDKDAANLAGVFKSDMLPAGSTVNAAIHAIAGSEIGADIRFTCTDVDHIRIRGRDSERANRGDRFPIKNRLPYGAGIRRLPNAAIDPAKIENAVAAGNSADGDHTTSAEWSDESPLQPVEQSAWHGLRNGCDWQDQTADSGKMAEGRMQPIQKGNLKCSHRSSIVKPPGQISKHLESGGLD